MQVHLACIQLVRRLHIQIHTSILQTPHKEIVRHTDLVKCHVCNRRRDDDGLVGHTLHLHARLTIPETSISKNDICSYVYLIKCLPGSCRADVPVHRYAEPHG